MPAPVALAAGTLPAAGPERALEYVHPGQVRVGGGQRAFATILGSCVAVTLHDASMRIGGLNHFLLPGPAEGVEPSARYASRALEELLARMLRAGARRQRLVARLVGGASVLDAFRGAEDHLGLRNAAAARVLLAAHGIPIVDADVGGTRGRRLVFVPADGACTVTLLGR